MPVLRTLSLGDADLEMPQVGVLFGTHNRQSCDIILRALVSSGLAKAKEGMSKVEVANRIVDRLAFGQLYGAILRLLGERIQVMPA